MLFQIIAPDIAIFGEKDWQQLALIRRMVRDLRMPVKIMAHPTVRENDGLALSSRNRFLTSEDRSVAPRVYESLKARSKEASEGEVSVARLRRDLIRDLSAIPGAKVEYAEIVNESTLSPMEKIGEGGTARALVALRLGAVRLIDNMALPSPR
jgi:pantoate--beta-alanine ligase